MITKERLEELIEQKAKIYGISKNNNIFCVGLKVKDNSICYFIPNYKETDWYKKQIEVYSKFYETKEEAEFVQKFHTSKIIFFTPPTWEEFLKTETDEVKPNYTCENLVIVEDYNEIIVEDYNNDLNEKHFSYNKELNNRKQKYYEAVEYAKKLFLGEEENEET